ncbi:Thymidine kinase protein [Raphanus sativus]|nr:Thymidine kinase protein [Raphanus sativus]
MIPQSVLPISFLGGGTTYKKVTLMLATVNSTASLGASPVSPLLIRFNDSTTLDEITESSNQVECTLPHQLDIPDFEQDRRGSRAYSQIGHAFNIVKMLTTRSFGDVLEYLPITDSVTKFTARCDVCGQKGFFTVRKTCDTRTELMGGANARADTCVETVAAMI